MKCQKIKNNNLLKKGGKMDRADIFNLTTIYELLQKQQEFQKFLKNPIPNKIVEFEHIQKALEHNTYQNIEFQEFMEANNYEKKEELIDYLLFMLNKYIFLGIFLSDFENGYLEDILWGNEKCSSSASCSCYASIEQYEFIKLLRDHCTFKPWKIRENTNCAELNYVEDTFKLALEHFRKLAKVTFDSYIDLYSCLIKKLLINVDRQLNNY